VKDEHGEKQPTMFIVVKLQGFRTIGDRSGLCDGEDPIEWCGSDGEWTDKWLSTDPPVAARAKVYRKDRSRPQVVVCRWDAYAQNVWDKQGREVPNAIWKRMGSHMLGKCALAGCYRGLFPRQASGVYLSEELGEEPDTESEAAIEAEMTRRYTREAEYWEKEKAKGHFPVGHKAEQTAPAPEPEPYPEPEPPPKEVSEHLVSTTQAPPEDSRAGNADWRSFVITRIRLFEGRAVNSLNESELEGLVPWLEKAGASWGTIDRDLRAHFTAISQARQAKAAAPKRLLSPEEELQRELDYAARPK
jgi:hypothetical protein